MKAINSGDKTGALKIYSQRFAQFRNMKKSMIMASLDRARVARERQGPCGYFRAYTVNRYYCNARDMECVERSPHKYAK